MCAATLDCLPLAVLRVHGWLVELKLKLKAVCLSLPGAAVSCAALQCVPALASEYLYAFKEAGYRLSCLTRFLTGGEALTPKLAEEIVATLPGLQKGGLFNSYGPTEVTVTVRLAWAGEGVREAGPVSADTVSWVLE